MIGSSVYGILADKIGRKPTLLLSLVNTCVAGASGAWVNSYIGYCVTRFFTGFGNFPILYLSSATPFSGAAGILIAGYNLSLELTGHKTKSFVGTFIHTGYALGEAFAGVLASQIEVWRDYQVS